MVNRRLKVPDEAWHAMQLAEDRRQQQQRVDDVEGVVADEEHGAVGAQKSAEPLEVDDVVPVVATQRIGQGEERSRRPRLEVDGRPRHPARSRSPAERGCGLGPRRHALYGHRLDGDCFHRRGLGHRLATTGKLNQGPPAVNPG